MRYTDGAPNIVYLVVETTSGDVLNVCTRKRDARAALSDYADGVEVRIATYDQRRPRG